MHAKLKRRVNKLFGLGTWQKLSQNYKDLLIHVGSHEVWRKWKQGTQSLDEIMRDANFKIEQEKDLARLAEEEGRLEITPAGEGLLKELVK